VAAVAQVEQHKTNSIKNNQWLAHDFINAHYNNFFSVQRPAISTLNHALQYHTTQIGLPALLRYADRNSMAHGCEVRLPFLSHQLVSFVFSLPASLKIKEGFSKYILRAAMQTQLPASICWRTNKIGFEPPQELWMKEATTQQYIHAAKEKLVATGILKAGVLQQKIQPHAAHAAENNDWRFLVAATLL
jgi:asparagine synthase (glutamine-hydrolysing)